MCTSMTVFLAKHWLCTAAARSHVVPWKGVCVPVMSRNYDVPTTCVRCRCHRCKTCLTLLAVRVSCLRAWNSHGQCQPITRPQVRFNLAVKACSWAFVLGLTCKCKCCNQYSSRSSLVPPWPSSVSVATPLAENNRDHAWPFLPCSWHHVQVASHTLCPHVAAIKSRPCHDMP